MTRGTKRALPMGSGESSDEEGGEYGAKLAAADAETARAADDAAAEKAETAARRKEAKVEAARKKKAEANAIKVALKVIERSRVNDQQIEVLKAALAASKAESEKALADKNSTRNGRVPKPTRKAKEAGDVDEYEV